MGMLDLGPVTLHTSSESIDVYSPYNKALVSEMKKLGGRFEKPSKRWRIRHAGDASETTVRKLRSALLRMGPKGWPEAFRELRAYTTVTEEYIITVGEPGLRVDVPSGTRAETALRRVEGVERQMREEGAFYLWPSTAMSDEARKALAIVQQADLRRFEETTRWMRDRRITGRLFLGGDDPAAFGLAQGGHVFAERGFIANADPAYKIAPLTEFALRIHDVEILDDGTAEIVCSYLAGEDGYKALKTRKNGDDSRPCLTLEHAGSTFAADIPNLDEEEALM